jgi:hypothetical protein
MTRERHRHANTRFESIPEAFAGGEDRFFSAVEEVNLRSIDLDEGVTADIDLDQPGYRIVLRPENLPEDATFDDFLEEPSFDERGDDYVPLSDWRWEFQSDLVDLYYAYVTHSRDPAEIIVGKVADTRYGNVVTDADVLRAVNETRDCPCGFANDSYLVQREFQHPTFECFCGRQYFETPGMSVTNSMSGSEIPSACNPLVELATDESGLVRCDASSTAFWMLSQQSSRVAEYLEPVGVSAETWLWAADGLYIGALAHVQDTLRTTVIAHGFRYQGHGTEFIETWFDAVEYDDVSVDHFNDRETFVDRLNLG